jgi:oligopeptide transport system permease protein
VRLPRLRTGGLGLVLLLAIGLPCLVTLPWSLANYDAQHLAGGVEPSQRPGWSQPMGTDALGRSVLWRCLLGGAISLSIGLAAAVIAVGIGVGWGALAGYRGGRVDSALMRTVDVLYGLPYILLIGLANLSLQPAFEHGAERVVSWGTKDAAAMEAGRALGGLLTLVVALGALSWLTMARVIRGQVLSLRGQPFIEAARACGVGPVRLLRSHLLPNLVGPIVVYATLTVPSVILQESFLSFLGLGVRPPLPSWGSLTSEGVKELSMLVVNPAQLRWWLIFWPCALLGLTLLALNFLGDGLRERLDPKARR